jgi:caffeoyl-CoA O-methyltransferase
MNFLPEEIAAYTEAHSQDESPVLKELNRETQAHVLMPRMLSGHLQGRVLAMLSKMIAPKHILEIGTYTGYSAICLAEGLQPDGLLHTIDINEELSDLVEGFITKAGLHDRIKTYTGDALSIIPTINEEFDLVFIDADKENYSRYYDLVLPRIRPGGFIIADNVLWSGNVLKPSVEMDEETRAIDDFNKKVQADVRVENVLLPVRDGLMVIRKTSAVSADVK